MNKLLHTKEAIVSSIAPSPITLRSESLSKPSLLGSITKIMGESWLYIYNFYVLYLSVKTSLWWNVQEDI